MKLLRSIGGGLSLAVVLGLLLASVPAGAQTLTALQLERSIQLSNILTSITPTGFSATTLAALAAGALDLREQVNYNPQQNTITSTSFVVTTGAPAPTNLGTLPPSSIVAVFTISIGQTLITSTAVQLAGTITQSSATPYGSYQGYPATYSFGYVTKSGTTTLSNIVGSIAGTIVIYSATADSSSITITQPPSGGGGGGGTGITISINGMTGATPTFQTTTNQVILNASASTSTNAGALTYAWVVTQGTASVSFPGGTTSTANVQLGSGHGTYVITLTITDATGATSKATITIQYV